MHADGFVITPHAPHLGSTIMCRYQGSHRACRTFSRIYEPQGCFTLLPTTAAQEVCEDCRGIVTDFRSPYFHLRARGISRMGNPGSLVPPVKQAKLIVMARQQRHEYSMICKMTSCCPSPCSEVFFEMMSGSRSGLNNPRMQIYSIRVIVLGLFFAVQPSAATDEYFCISYQGHAASPMYRGLTSQMPYITDGVPNVRYLQEETMTFNIIRSTSEEKCGRKNQDVHAQLPFLRFLTETYRGVRVFGYESIELALTAGHEQSIRVVPIRRRLLTFRELSHR